MEKIGKYTIVEILGKGAMGIVYKALDPDIDREVAIKTIRFDLISDESEKNELMLRFIREARSAGNLLHPNIITIYDVGKEKDMTYIVMQYVEGSSLQNWITSRKKIPAPAIVRLMVQICEALDYAHRNGIVHRDIKPANILLDEEGKPFLVDFGVAHVEMSTITQTGAAIGTPSYMSPEQVMGKKIDKRSDIFSLGAILYELLTGRRPFEGESITTVIYKIVNEEAMPLSHFRKEIPSEFEAIVKKALSKDPEKRYRSCSELAAELRKITHFSDRTLAMTGYHESSMGFEPPLRKRKNFVLPLVLMGAMTVLGVGGFFLYRNVIAESNAGESVHLVQSESAIPSPRAMGPVLEAFDTEWDRLAKSYERGDYSSTIKIAEGLLSQNNADEKAREYLSKAQKKLSETTIADCLLEGKGAFEKGNYELCMANMEKILKLDSENRDAKHYLSLADKAISERKIREVIESQRRAEEQKDLLAFLSQIGAESLAEKKKIEAMELFNNFDDIKSNISSLSVRFIDQDHADVSFSRLLVAVDKKSGKKKVVFEGKMTLTLERLDNIWKILVYK